MPPFKAVIFVSLLAAVIGASEIRTGSCFAPGADVVIGFNNADAQAGDWVGLIPASIAGTLIPNARSSNWVRSCGSKTCGTSPPSGFLSIANPNLNGATQWVAVLAHFSSDGSPHTLIAKSSPFQVSSSCSVPVPAQPQPPPPAPTRSAAKPSTSAVATVVTDKKLYQLDEQISVTFLVGAGSSRHWVGIFNANVPISQQKQGNLWLWAGCDRQGFKSGCTPRTIGAVTFRGNKDVSWQSSWPLPPGQYVAALINGGRLNPPWDVLDVSPTFQIQATNISQKLVNMVRQDITQLIKSDIALAAKFLRLGFHDSVGGPDGCVDLTNPENKGLDVPISALSPIVKKYAGILSRADIWAMAAMVGPDVSQPSNAKFKVDFDFTEFGRIDCEKQQTVCRNAAGVSHGCSATRGPHREVPGMNINTHDLFTFFQKNYGFSTADTVAIMGAHTIGTLERKNSGVDGPNGWVINKRRFDNEYYHHLVGGTKASDPIETLVQDAPNWTRLKQLNHDLVGIPDVNVWHGNPPELKGGFIVMLNADIAIVRDLNTNNMDSETGKVRCQFVDRSGTSSPTCPMANGALQQAARYTFNNKAWLIDFQSALRRLLHAKYRISSTCFDGICKLVK